MKIYTKTGDTGKTSLLGKKDVLKSDLRINAYGSVDELNASIGLLASFISKNTDPSINELSSEIESIQNHLFTIGSLLACVDDEFYKSLPKLKAEWIESLEKKIDDFTKLLSEQREFILPGGSLEAAQSHVSRTICRRAERVCVDLFQSESGDEAIITYLNRLSDFLHVLARRLNQLHDVPDIKWVKE